MVKRKFQNIYEQKSKWKLWLMLFAAVIVGLSLWYNSIIASRIASSEKNQVQIWAQAVRQRARLLERQNELFERLAEEERRKVQLYADAIHRALSTSIDADVDPIITNIISSNQNIPVVMVDAENRVLSYRNVDDPSIQDGAILSDSTLRAFTNYEPIVDSKFTGANRIYYQDSKLFKEIKQTIQSYMNSFISEVVLNAASVPVIYADNEGNILAYGNLDTLLVKKPGYLKDKMEKMASENDPIVIDLQDGSKQFIYYSGSDLLSQIQIYPYIQFGIIALFLFIAYYAFSTARRSEQNKVWVGMSKETAHQLGTPISSLVGWVEYLRSTGTDEKVVNELEKDVNRLELITERFSKIGSSPELKETDLKAHLRDSFSYLQSRTSRQARFVFEAPDDQMLNARINGPLFDWVIENLVKNALDAMEGVGELKLSIQRQNGQILIDLNDSGKGIPKSKFKEIFNPGYSTKKRGWGLGLSLTKRIVENYHNGKVFVRQSEPGKGSTFRIVLPAA